MTEEEIRNSSWEAGKRADEREQSAAPDRDSPLTQAVADAFLVFGLRETASLEEVKRRYKEEAVAWHPDRFPPGSKLHVRAVEKLKELNTARKVLEGYARETGTGRSGTTDEYAPADDADFTPTSSCTHTAQGDPSRTSTESGTSNPSQPCPDATEFTRTPKEAESSGSVRDSASQQTGVDQSTSPPNCKTRAPLEVSIEMIVLVCLLVLFGLFNFVIVSTMDANRGEHRSVFAKQLQPTPSEATIAETSTSQIAHSESTATTKKPVPLITPDAHFPNSAVAGSFTVWLIPILGFVDGLPQLGNPIDSPKHNQDYFVVVQFSVPDDTQEYRLTDLTGEIIGIDLHRMWIPSDTYVQASNGSLVPVASTAVLLPKHGVIRLFFRTPSPHGVAVDKLRIRSNLLNEEQTIVLKVQRHNDSTSRISDQAEGRAKRSRNIGVSPKGASSPETTLRTVNPASGGGPRDDASSKAVGPFHEGNAAYARQAYQEALSCWKTAITESDHADRARAHLAWLLATCPDDAVRNGSEALQLAKHFIASPSRDKRRIWKNYCILAAAHAESGDFLSARIWQEEALKVSPQEWVSEMKLMLFEFNSGYRHKDWDGGVILHEEAQYSDGTTDSSMKPMK